MKVILTCVLMFKATMMMGQVMHEEINLRNLEEFIPDGYAVLDTATGDLNRDSINDLIVLYKKIDEDQTSDVIDNPEKRILALYIGSDDDTFKLAAKNDSAVYCYDCGGMMGDPYQGIVIKNGYFTVEHYGGSSWRWTRCITFKYSLKDKNWYLHKDGGDSFHASDPENITTNIQTVSDFGLVTFQKYDIYDGN